ELVDIDLVFGDARFPCHKVVLASTSDYFRQQFSSNEVVMKGIDEETGKLIVNYLYTGEIDINDENVKNLLSASEMFQLNDLKAECEKFLCKHIQLSNCVSLLNLSHRYELKDLAEKSRQFVTENWTELPDDSIIELKKEDLESILIERLHENPENHFACLQIWVKSDKERDEQFVELVQHVDLSRCSP
ncbi:hypothetical protein CAPTEDRAFT_85541, partial [Capitella teleta]